MPAQPVSARLHRPITSSCFIIPTQPWLLIHVEFVTVVVLRSITGEWNTQGFQRSPRWVALVHVEGTNLWIGVVVRLGHGHQIESKIPFDMRNS